MSKPIPDYTESLKVRFRKDVEIQLIESEIRLNTHNRELTKMPGLYVRSR